MNTPAILQAVVYGDLETMTVCKEDVVARSASSIWTSLAGTMMLKAFVGSTSPVRLRD